MPIIVTMPALSPTMEEGTISSWMKKEGDKVSDGDSLCEIATDKSTVEFQAIDGGFLRKIIVPSGSSAKVNDPIAIITETMEEDISSVSLGPTETEKPQEDISQTNNQEESSQKDVPQQPAAAAGLNVMTFSPPPAREKIRSVKKTSHRASPLAKKIAQEQGVDLSSIKGTGPSGRIIAGDLEGAPQNSFTGTKKTSYAYPDGTFEEISLTPVRKIIGERLQASKMTIPHYVISQSVNMNKAMALRSELKELGIKVTFNDFVIKAVVLALCKHPEVNTGYDSKNSKIIQYKTVDLSLAVSVPDGLITPILWQADYMSLTDISAETKKLVIKAKEGTLDPHEYQGGSFTISNLGMFGVTGFQAVINPPQAAILAVGGITETAVSTDGIISSAHLMNISISLDHRVIDGAEGAQFINSVKYFIENPSSLII